MYFSQSVIISQSYLLSFFIRRPQTVDRGPREALAPVGSEGLQSRGNQHRGTRHDGDATPHAGEGGLPRQDAPLHGGHPLATS